MAGFFQGRKAAEFLNATEEMSGVSLSDPGGGVFRSLSNRKQVLLFVIATLVLTAVTVWAARVWFRHTSTLTFAVGTDAGVEAKFAAKLAGVLQANNSSLRLKIDKNADSDKALAAFDRKQADLAILRTDQKVPSRARAIAVLDKDLVLMLSPKGKKIANLEALKGKKIAVLGNDDRNEAFIRRALASYDIANPRTSLQTVPAGSSIDKLLAPNGFAAVIAIENAARIGKERMYERLAKGQGFTLNAIPEAKAIERKIPGIFAETIDEGLLSTSPQMPDDDVQSLGLQWMLIGQSLLSESKGTELARTLFENKYRAGRHRQGFVHLCASWRCAILQRRDEIVHRALQRLALCRTCCAQHHRLDLRRPLHGVHARGAGKGRSARSLPARDRREDRG
jgi:TRAP-type uncharacterized transport system substrate-binding protein